MRVGGAVHFATDMADYAAWTFERFLRAPGVRLDRRTRRRLARAVARSTLTTRYEAKAKREGRMPNYFVFRRTAP